MVFFDREELEKFLLSNPQKTVEQIDMEASTRVALSRGGAVARNYNSLFQVRATF
ncbi:MAG: hypothetical protein U5M51_15605 [Emticicia sp.]|nr:hypothetical protein [Emticicia sp.]